MNTRFMSIYKYRMTESRFQSSFEDLLLMVEQEEGVNAKMDVKYLLQNIFRVPNDLDMTSSNHPFQRYGPGTTLDVRRDRIWEDIGDIYDDRVQSAFHMMLDISDTELFDAFTTVLSRFRIFAISRLPGSDVSDTDSD